MGNHRPESPTDSTLTGHREMCAFNWPDRGSGSEPYPTRRSVIVRADVPSTRRGRHRNPHHHHHQQHRGEEEPQSPSSSTTPRISSDTDYNIASVSGPSVSGGYTTSPTPQWNPNNEQNISSPWLPSPQLSSEEDQQISNFGHSSQSYHWTTSSTEVMPEQQRQGGPGIYTEVGIPQQQQQQLQPNYQLEEQRLYETMRDIPPPHAPPRPTPPNISTSTVTYETFFEPTDTTSITPRIRRTTVIPATSNTGSGGVIQQLVFQNQPQPSRSIQYLPSIGQSRGHSSTSPSTYEGHFQEEPLMNQSISSTSGQSPEPSTQHSSSTMLRSSVVIDPTALHQPDSDGDLPLHIAVAKENEQEVAHLIHMMTASQHRSSLDVYNKLKQTPLHVAIMTGHLGIIQRLVAAGSSPSIPDRHGNTAMHLAVRLSSMDCINILLNSLTSNAILHQQNYNGYTPLHLAVFRGNVDLIELLISKGANCNTTDGTSGRTPLFHAVLNGHEDVVRKLISLGASVNMPNYAGVTPLVVATDRRLKNITSLLISRGGTIVARDDT